MLLLTMLGGQKTKLSRSCQNYKLPQSTYLTRCLWTIRATLVYDSERRLRAEHSYSCCTLSQIWWPSHHWNTVSTYDARHAAHPRQTCCKHTSRVSKKIHTHWESHSAATYVLSTDAYNMHRHRQWKRYRPLWDVAIAGPPSVVSSLRYSLSQKVTRKHSKWWNRTSNRESAGKFWIWKPGFLFEFPSNHTSILLHLGDMCVWQTDGQTNGQTTQTITTAGPHIVVGQLTMPVTCSTGELQSGP